MGAESRARDSVKWTLLDAVNDAIFTERSPSAIKTERADRVARLAVGRKCGPDHTGRAPVARAKAARTRIKETARARTPRRRKESELKGTADTLEMEAPTKGLFIGRDKCAERKLTLQRSRMWIRRPSRHWCQRRHREASQTRACQMNRGTIAESGASQVNPPTTPSKNSRTERALRTTVLLGTSAVHTDVLECRLDRPV